MNKVIVTKNSSYADSEVCTRPTWQQVKCWLWEKHKLLIKFDDDKDDEFSFKVETLREVVFNEGSFDSPITAEVEGLMKAVEYLYKENKSA